MTKANAPLPEQVGSRQHLYLSLFISVDAHSNTAVMFFSTASRLETVYIQSTLSTQSIESVAQASLLLSSESPSTSSPKWFQLYIYKDREVRFYCVSLDVSIWLITYVCDVAEVMLSLMQTDICDVAQVRCRCPSC